jgi:hypothetical protein
LLFQLGTKRGHRFELSFLFRYFMIESANLLILFVQHQHMLICLVLHQSVLLPLIRNSSLKLLQLLSDLKNFFILHCNFSDAFVFGFLNFLIGCFIKFLFVNLQFIHSGIYFGFKVFLSLFPNLFKLICKLLWLRLDRWFSLFLNRFVCNRLGLLFAAHFTVILCLFL